MIRQSYTWVYTQKIEIGILKNICTPCLLQQYSQMLRYINSLNVYQQMNG